MSKPVHDAPQVAFHFALSHGKDCTLSAFGRKYPLRAHTAETLRAHPAAGKSTREPTHYTHVSAPPENVIQLIRVYGPDGADGIPTLESIAIYTPQSPTTYGNEDLAKAILFLHPSLTVLTAESAPAVLGHIESSSTFGEMVAALDNGDGPWNTITKITDENGDYKKYPSGAYVFQYDLDPGLERLRAVVARGAAIGVNSDEALRNVRWGVQNGQPYRDISPAPTSAVAAAAGNASGYRYDLQDPGPKFGVSCKVLGLDDQSNIRIRLTNNYIRHCSAFVSFIGGDGKTPIPVPDEIWTTLLKGAILAVFEAWRNAIPQEALDLVLDQKNLLKFLGTLGSETTFMGIPVESTSSDYEFTLPLGDHTISRIRVFSGSLGLHTDSDAYPQAAWIGIGMTMLLDLFLPTLAIALTVGLPSSKLIGSISSNILFVAPIMANIALAIKDSVENPDKAGGDVAGQLTAVADSLLKRVLGASDIAELVALFVSEEVIEAIPFVGWALKAEAIEAALEQLAQTVGEVLGSDSVVSFDITVTMTVKLQLKPVSAGGFPATATKFTITAQYTDVTGYVYTHGIADPKVAELDITWNGMPVGGRVVFVVAFYSKEGWLVGKGTTASVENRVTEGRGALVVPPIAITELLYPLDSETTYGHSQILRYAGGVHKWTQSGQAPPQTFRDLGTGAGGHILDQVTGIAINSDTAILGYSWQASGQNVPLIGTNGRRDEPVYTFQNISFGPDAEAALMFTPAGYDTSPQLAYLRTSASSLIDGAHGLEKRSLFFVDPVADDTGYFHLRGIAPGSKPREFDLSTSKSWGRFRLLPTSMAVSAAGVVLAISNIDAERGSKLQILVLPAAAGPSSNAPRAQLCSGPGTREGLILEPQAICIAPNQTILVLEAGNMRVQAFSSGGHPAKVFPDPNPYWFPLFTEPSDSPSVTWLSMSVDVQGYVFVPSFEDDGYVAADFRLDVYTPDGHHLFRQRGINCGAMTLDLWRNLYTLNFEAILGPDDRTEPSVSEWIPSTPKTAPKTARS